MGITPAMIGGAISAGGALAGLFGGSGSSNQPTPPQGYQPQYQGWMDQSFASGLPQQQTYNTAASTLPQYGQITQAGINNPYASTYQSGANAAAGLGWATGLGQVGAGNTAINSAQSLLPYAQQILQTSFDPMGSVYNQQFQQNTDQTRAGLEARGVNTSPYGAGIENQSNINFNNNWQQNLLARMTQGAQGASSLTNSQIAGLNAGVGAQTAGLNTLNTANALPYSTANTITGNQLGLLNQYGQQGANATNTSQTSLEDMLKYLGYGNQTAGVNNAAYASQLQGQNNQFNQQQTLGKNLGAGLQGMFGNSGSFSLPGSSSWGAANPGASGSSYFGPVAP